MSKGEYFCYRGATPRILEVQLANIWDTESLEHCYSLWTCKHSNRMSLLAFRAKELYVVILAICMVDRDADEHSSSNYSCISQIKLSKALNCACTAYSAAHTPN